jgi:serine/threonine protein kinase/Tol biopolymer transport system component
VTTERWREIQKIFAEALEKKASERVSYLNEACADASLREQVELMIAAHEQGDSDFLEPLAARSSEELKSGDKIGPYTILVRIGAGGMGEVYRAHDTKLKRDVAIKVLPLAFVNDPERLERFQREARLLASLNHPNIATIYGLEDSDSTHALVMELVEGPTLTDRIRQGPIPVEEALPIAKQMAEALEYAHEHGIIHRDLKPANVKVTADDTVKILDFGLAKALETGPSTEDIANSPTLSRMATQTGVLLGTAAYMSPEQAKAKPVDRRADIWAFGCVLYEMLTGKRAFRGEAVTETLAAVLTKDPDFSQLPVATPMRVRVLLQRCMQKDPKQRLQAIGDARISLDEVLSGAPEAAPEFAVPVSRWRRALPWGLFATMTAAFAALAFIHFREVRPAAAPPIRFQISLPEPAISGLALAMGANGTALSPDGRQLAFAGIGSDGVRRLWVRSLDSLEARPLAGTESGIIQAVAWSPDSRYIAFTSAQSGAGGSSELLKVALSGGPAENVCGFTGNSGGGAWSPDGVIIFSTGHGLMSVTADGGPPQPLTTTTGFEQDNFPQFLPDGGHFIYSHMNAGEKSGVYVGSLDAKPKTQSSKRLLGGEMEAEYVPSTGRGTGYLLFGRAGSLMAQAFDARHKELLGEATTVVDGAAGGGAGAITFSASANGTLAYVSTSRELTTLEWFDRHGIVQGTPSSPSSQNSLTLSPDGNRAFIFSTRFDSHLSLVDFARGTKAPFTFRSSPAGEIAGDPVWSPDGRHVIFGASVGGAYASLFEKPISGEMDEVPILESPGVKHPRSWSPDGRLLLYDALDPTTGKSGIWALPLGGGRKPVPVMQGRFNVGSGRISPDDHWIAYGSDESGKPEVFVREFSSNSEGNSFTLGGAWQVSSGGAVDPRWRGDGKELYYRTLDGKVMAVEVVTNPTFQAGPPTELFQGPPLLYPPGASAPSQWGVTADGKRFLFSVLPGQNTTPAVTVLLNWQAALKK